MTNANRRKDTVFYTAKRCAGYACLLRQLSRAWFYGKEKSVDAAVSKRIATSLSVITIKRFSSLLSDALYDVNLMFFRDSVKTTRQDFAVVALGILVYTLKHLKDFRPDEWVPSIIVWLRFAVLYLRLS